MDERRAVSDGSLLARLHASDEEAAELLHARYAGRLRELVRAYCSAPLARRVEPEDIVQSAFRCFFGRAARVPTSCRRARICGGCYGSSP